MMEGVQGVQGQSGILQASWWKSMLVPRASSGNDNHDAPKCQRQAGSDVKEWWCMCRHGHDEVGKGVV